MISSAHRACDASAVLTGVQGPRPTAAGFAALDTCCALRWVLRVDDGQTGASGGDSGHRVPPSSSTHTFGDRGRWMVTGTIGKMPDLVVRQEANTTGSATLDRSLPRRSTVMSALPQSAGVIHGYQSDSSSKRPVPSIAFDLRACDRPFKPPDLGIGALTPVAPYQD